jgi:hypothetical protein
MAKRKSFRKDCLEIRYRDNTGKPIYVDKGDPDKVLTGFIGKFEGLETGVRRLGVKLDRRLKSFKRLLEE